MLVVDMVSGFERVPVGREGRVEKFSEPVGREEASADGAVVAVVKAGGASNVALLTMN